MEVSGEVADLVVKEGIQVTEAAAKLAGKGIINATALLVALAKDSHKVVGKTNIQRLAREDGEAVILPLKTSDLKSFDKLAKQYGLLYAAVKKKNVDTGVIDIISTVNYSPQLNLVFDAMGYARPQQTKDEQSAKKAKSRAPQEIFSTGRGNGSTPSQTITTSDKPSVRTRLEALRAASEQTKSTPVRIPDKTR